MALYAKAAGGNWSAAGTWSSTGSGGADNSGPPASTDDVIFEAGSGNVTIDATSNAKSISCIAGTGNYAGVLTHGAFNINVSGSITFVAGMTYTPAQTSLITFAASGTLTTAGLAMCSITQGSTLTLGDNLTFGAFKTLALTLNGTAVNMNGHSINGNSAINRILITSASMGTGKAITNATTSFTNADFRDITFTSATSLNLSAITGGSGDAGGNSITGGGSTLTFTASSTQTWSGTASDNWSTNAWTSRVPLPQDDVVIASAFTSGRTITVDMPRLGRSIDFSGMSWGATATLITVTVSCSIYGSLTLKAGVNFNVSALTVTMAGRSSYNLTTSGQTFGSGGGTFAVSMVGGTLTQLDAANFGVIVFSLTNGTYTANNFNVTANRFAFSSGTTVNMGSGTWTISSTSTASPWNMNAGTTINAGTSTLVLNSAASSNTFTGGGKTYNNFTIGTGSGTLTIANSNTFNVLTITAPKPVSFTIGTTQTVSEFIAVGSSGNLVTITSTSAGTPATLSKNHGNVQCDWLSVKDSTATGGASWYAGANSTSVSGNTGWIFTAFSSSSCSSSSSRSSSSSSRSSSSSSCSSSSSSCCSSSSCRSSSSSCSSRSSSSCSSSSCSSSSCRSSSSSSCSSCSSRSSSSSCSSSCSSRSSSSSCSSSSCSSSCSSRSSSSSCSSSSSSQSSSSCSSSSSAMQASGNLMDDIELQWTSSSSSQSSSSTSSSSSSLQLVTRIDTRRSYLPVAPMRAANIESSERKVPDGVDIRRSKLPVG